MWTTSFHRSMTTALVVHAQCCTDYWQVQPPSLTVTPSLSPMEDPLSSMPTHRHRGSRAISEVGWDTEMTTNPQALLTRQNDASASDQHRGSRNHLSLTEAVSSFKNENAAVLIALSVLSLLFILLLSMPVLWWYAVKKWSWSQPVCYLSLLLTYLMCLPFVSHCVNVNFAFIQHLPLWDPTLLSCLPLSHSHTPSIPAIDFATSQHSRFLLLSTANTS